MTSYYNTPPADDEPQNRLREDSPPLPSLRPIAPATRRHPLQSFGLANFKAFGANEQTIPLRPITLIFGPNSGGKSSILHYLLWMKDVVGGRGLDISHPSAGGESVDLGGFRQLRHGINSCAQISSRFNVTLKNLAKEEYALTSLSVFAASRSPRDYESRLKALIEKRFREQILRYGWETIITHEQCRLLIFGLEHLLVGPSIEELLADVVGEHTLKRHLADCLDGNHVITAAWRREHCPKLHDAWLHLGGFLFEAGTIDEGLSLLKESPPLIPSALEALEEVQTLACAVYGALNFRPPPVTEMKPSLVRFELREREKIVLRAERNEAFQLCLTALDLDWLTTFYAHEPIVRSIRSQCLSTDDLLGRVIFDDTATWLPRNARLEFTSESDHGIDESSGLRDVLKLIEGTPEKPGLIRICDSAVQEQFEELTYLGPLRAYPSREITVAALPKAKDPEGLFAWRLLYQDPALRIAVNEWLGRGNISSRYEVVADDRVSFADVSKRAAEELQRRIKAFRTEAMSAFELDNDGQIKAGIIKHGNSLQDWDDETAISDTMQWVRSAVASDSTATVFLRDVQSGKQVSSRDIGVGVSQLIPVIVQAKAAQGELIVIEQPEIHIHPALQAELGDVFIESALQRGNTFLIETHSEHLILRLLRRIRETTAGELNGRMPLTPADIAVLYVEPGEGGAKVIEIPVGTDGDFDRPWPNGFFAERSRELF